MKVITKIKENYLMRKLKDSEAATIGPDGKIPMSQLPGSQIHIGKIDGGKFYAIQYVINSTTGVYETLGPYPLTDEKGQPDHLYLDVTTMQLYRYDPVNKGFVAIKAANPS